jgi:hypothetical protein
MIQDQHSPPNTTHNILRFKLKHKTLNKTPNNVPSLLTVKNFCDNSFVQQQIVTGASQPSSPEVLKKSSIKANKRANKPAQVQQTGRNLKQQLCSALQSHKTRETPHKAKRTYIQ